MLFCTGFDLHKDIKLNSCFLYRYTGIVIYDLWSVHSKFRILKNTEDIPFVQTWMQVLKKRSFLALIWAVGALIVAGLVVLVSTIIY
jgi:hypothetical protein